MTIPRTTWVDSARAAQALAEAGLDGSGALPPSLARFAAKLSALITTPAPIPADDAALVALFRYAVPELSADGSCSLSDRLADEPFDLRDAELRRLAPAELRAHPEAARLARLGAVVEALHGVTGSDWTGIYRRVRREGEPDALRKEAYRGRPSRALFPLTEEFARQSNNTTAALSMKAIVVDDVEEHLRAGRPYYECDADVRSELCFPIVSGGRASGLIDLESFRPGTYGRDAAWATALVSTAILAAGLLPVE